MGRLIVKMTLLWLSVFGEVVVVVVVEGVVDVVIAIVLHLWVLGSIEWWKSE